jgi:1,2-diacylglycerol 3-alpha-glucosyltransferase
MSAARRTRVFFVCPGLGHVARGFETFSRECFDAIREDERLECYLFKGAGPAFDHERAVWCLRRGQAAAGWLGATLRRDSYYAEQVTFVLGLLPHLIRMRPDVVYFSDGVVGNMLWRWRRLTKARFKLLLSNGGPLGPPGFPRFDHVHQVLTAAYDESAEAGRSPESQTLLPYGFQIDFEFRLLTRDARMALRQTLELPTDRPLVLTIGAVNQSHKRMDYVIREVAALPAPRPFLVILGQREAETTTVLTLANQLLGPAGFSCRTVPADQVQDYYSAADVFVLGSLKEGFGRVLVEALIAGLPCLAADRLFAREVLGTNGCLGDFERPGEMTRLLSSTLAKPGDPNQAIVRHTDAYTRLSWDVLRPRYVDMIERCARTCSASRHD